MGFNNNAGGSRKFATIADGKIVLSHQNPIEGVTETRMNKNGKLVHEQKFTSFTGRLVSIASKDTNFGMLWEVTMTDGDETVVISWNYSSRYTNNFFRLLPNVDLSEDIELAPWSMLDKVDKTKKVTGLTIYQNINGKRTKVPFFYSKEEPNGLPELKKIEKKKGGKVTVEWDDSDQMEFFEKYLTEKILPILAGRTVAPSPVASDEAPF